ncbi:MAG: manganese efflux pump [bacterium]|nr:manganese efflux pump [bacterium]
MSPSMSVSVLLLVLALCLDAFVASMVYGTNGISISHKQIAVFNGICSLCLGAALLFGTFLDSQIPEVFTKRIGFFSLLLLGGMRLFDSSIRQYLKKHKAIHKNASFHFSNLRFIISIYSDPIEADADQNQNLSWREVLFFSFAMSIDSLAAGVMAAFLKVPILWTMMAAFLMGDMFTYMGIFLGKKIRTRCPKDLSWAGGLLFILLAILRCL